MCSRTRDTPEGQNTPPVAGERGKKVVAGTRVNRNGQRVTSLIILM